MMRLLMLALLLAGCSSARDDRVTTFSTTWPVYPSREFVDRLMALNPDPVAVASFPPWER